jgi:hypothetical protein
MSQLPTPVSEEHSGFTADAIREQKISTGLSRILEASKIKHVGTRAEAVAAVRAKLEAQGVSWKVSDRNWLCPVKGGQPANLQNLVDQVLLLNKDIGAPESVQEQVAAGALTVEAKSDLATVAQKVAFISQFGDAAWARLPSTRVAPANTDPLTMGRGDYNRMTVQQKITFQKRADVTEPILGAILRRP